jgi:hypothetical protein
MRFLKFRGRRKCLTHWAIEMGLSPALVHSRLTQGWSTERALTEPVQVHKRTTGRVASPIYEDVRERLAASNAAFSDQMHRLTRTFLKDFADALALQAEVAAKQMTRVSTPGVGQNFPESVGTGVGPQRKPAFK